MPSPQRNLDESFTAGAAIFTPPLRLRADHIGMHRFATPLLDRELLAGADPQGDPALERRGMRVCGRRNRDRLAAALEAFVAAAERGHGGLTSAAPVPSDDVLPSRTQLRDLARRLRSDAPVDPQGVLLLRRLLTDPASPLTSGAGPAPLRAAARQASAALTPRYPSSL
jgi:hypothetical protein